MLIGYHNSHLTQAIIDLGRLRHNMELLQSLAGNRPLFPAVKANAYGHGDDIVARELVRLGHHTLCTAHISEAAQLVEKGVQADFIILSPTLPENSKLIAHYGFQPVVCTLQQVQSLAQRAAATNRRIGIHIKVDTGMGRVGVEPDKLAWFVMECEQYPSLVIKGICSHFSRADEDDLAFTHSQLQVFMGLRKKLRARTLPLFHFANSAAIFSLPEARLDAVRPGIAIYGLKPSPEMAVPSLDQLQPMLTLKSRITHLKEVEPDTGISYGHMYSTTSKSSIATIPLGYGDGISRGLSNRFEVLVHGKRCPQIGRICMDQCMIDVSELGTQVHVGDEVIIIGSQGKETITADALARKQKTINYEIVTSLTSRVPRIAVSG